MASQTSAMAMDGTSEKGLWRVILSSAVGTMIEWYDFYIFGTLAAVLSLKFYPPGNDTFAYIAYLATFAATLDSPSPKQPTLRNLLLPTGALAQPQDLWPASAAARDQRNNRQLPKNLSAQVYERWHSLLLSPQKLLDRAPDEFGDLHVEFFRQLSQPVHLLRRKKNARSFHRNRVY